MRTFGNEAQAKGIINVFKQCFLSFFPIPQNSTELKKNLGGEKAMCVSMLKLKVQISKDK